MRRGLAIGLLVVALGGCMQTMPQPTLTMQMTGSQQAAPPRNATFATQLAGPNTYLAPMPTAVVLLKPDDMTRNRAFCEAVMKLPTAEEAMARSVVAPNLILTRWLTQLAEVPPERVRDCDYLVGTYDYSRAATLMASFHGNGSTVLGNGPFLALVIPGGTGLRVAAVDGSSYRAESFDRFVASWRDAIDRTQAQLSAQPDRPGLIRSVFDLVSAVLRTVFGGTVGLLEGTIGGL